MEVAELRKIDGGRRAETDGRHRAERDRRRRKKIKGGWETVQEGIAFTFCIRSRSRISHLTSPHIIILHRASCI